jgi:hypothetical protein
VGNIRLSRNVVQISPVPASQGPTSASTTSRDEFVQNAFQSAIEGPTG